MKSGDSKSQFPQEKSRKNNKNADIAVIGMACRFPDADDYTQFWSNLANGINSIKEIPKNRWDIKQYYSPDINEPNKSISKWCGLLNDVDKFDNSFFNISPHEANNMDPQQRLLLEETWHCIEDSGVPLSMLQKRKTSVYVGVMTADYRQEAVKPDVETDSYACLGSYECMLANRISYIFNFNGYSMSINAACASSLVSIHEAKRSLVMGESDYAVASGVSLNLHPWKYISFSKSRMLSPDGQCKTFDKDANGYVPGEGAGVLLLQRLDEALKDGNHIYGIIKGSGVNHGGKTLSITAPRVEAQQNVILSAYEDAGISPEMVTYVEAHGTGTSLGDPIEIEALTQAFRRYTNKNRFCRIGSVKTNIGHLEAAAGIAGLIKVLLMMRNKKIPKTLNIRTLNPVIKFERSPFIAATELADWHRSGENQPLRAGISSFGFGGVNSHVLVEEYVKKTQENRRTKGDSSCIFVLSAKTPDSLKGIVEKWASFIDKEEYNTYSLHDICATLLTGREAFGCRVGKCVNSIEQIKDFLKTVKTGSIHKKEEKVWCLRIGEASYNSFSDIEGLTNFDIYREKLDYILGQLGAIEIQLPAKFKKRTWYKKHLPLFSFIVGYSYILTLFELGFNPKVITSEGSGTWVGLAASRIVSLEDVLAVLSGKKKVEDIKLSRPEVDYYDSLTGRMFKPFMFDKEYLRLLIDGINIQKELLSEIIIDGDVQLENVLNKAVVERQEDTRLGILLVKNGTITVEQLESALAEQGAAGEKLGEILVKKGYCTVRDLEKSLREQQGLREYVDEARMLSVSQYTFKFYMEEWNSFLKPAGYNNIMDMLQDEELLFVETGELAKKQLLLLIIIVSSLRRLNKKWNLTEQRLIGNQKFYELLDLVVDEVMPKDVLVQILTGHNPDFLQAAEVLNKRQDRINLQNSYEYLISRNQFLQEIDSIPEWIDKALSAPLHAPEGIDMAFLNYGIVTEYDNSSNLINIDTARNTDMVFKEILLELWLNGIHVKWGILYPEGTYKRVPLPQYTFSRQSFWLPGSVSSERGGTRGHYQLVGKNVSDLKGVKFETRISGREFYVADHVVQERMVLPGVVYLEMVRQAGEAAGQKEIGKIKNVVWAKPVSFSSNKEPKHIYTGLCVDGGELRYEVWTDENNQKIIHSQGNLVFQHTGSDSIDIDAVKNRCNNSVNKVRCYASLKQAGLNYGPGLQTIQELSYNRTEAISRLELPSGYEEYEKFFLHPAIADGALQTVIILIQNSQDNPDTLYLPFALEEVEIIKPLEKRCYAYVTTADTGPGDGEDLKKFSILIMNESGKVLAKMKNLAVKASRTVAPGYKKNPYYQFSWHDAPVRLDALPDVLPEKVLIFDRDQSIWNLLKDKIDSVLVKPGKYFREVEDQVYEINPANPQDYYDLLDSVKSKGLIPDSIVHLWSREKLNNNSNSLSTQLERGIYSLFYSTQALMKQKFKGKVRFLYMFRGSTDGIQPQYAGAAGFARSIMIENPQFIYKVLEYLVSSDCEMDTERMTDIVLNELRLKEDDEIEIRYDDQSRYVKRLIGLKDEAEKKCAVSIREDGVYLITGGVGGLGLIFAEYLARKAGAKLVLVGRSELDVEKKAKILELERQGSEILYVKADISKKNDVDKLISRVKSQFRNINGVIHSAGILRDSFAVKKTKEEFEAVLAPKVYGTTYLDEALSDEKLDFFVLFSSAAAVRGNIGQCDYAYANSFLDSFAHMRNNLVEQGKRFGRTVSINWPLWENGGMKVQESMLDFVKDTIAPTLLSNQDGLKAFEDALTLPGSQLIIFEGERKIKEKALEQANPATLSDSRRKPEFKELDDGQLRKSLDEYLIQILSRETSYPIEEISVNESFEEYGIDSIMTMKLTSSLEKDFGSLSKTLFFEYRNISELASYLFENHRETAVKMFGLPETDITSSPPEPKINIGPPSTEEPESYYMNTKNDSVEVSETDIAIIGLSGRYPMAESLEDLWENLKNAKDCVTEIPEDRWDYSNYYNSNRDKKGRINSKWGGFIDDVDKFDPLFFNISPREAELMDPQERLFLQTVWHAFEDAGYTKGRLAGSNVGVFVGVIYGHYQLFAAKEYQGEDKIVPWPFFASIANRVSYFFDIHGPSMAVDTMCSSSLTAIHLACESIKKSESEIAIAGGVNVSIHPDKYIFLSQGRFTSSDGRCRAFGEGGDGYVPGEGVGAVLLKPLGKAIEDGDSIYAVIKGNALNHGGKTNGYTVPNPNAQAKLISRVIENAGIDPRTINYIEAHGTGTSLGDPIEITGLVKAFREYTVEKQYCSIGSIKSNIGHLEAAAGIAGLTKVLLQMKYKQLVPSIHSDKLNPNINFEETPFYVQRELKEWNNPVIEGTIYPRRAGISSFGAGGTNAHILLEEYDNPKVNTGSTNYGDQVIVLSAKSKERLKEYALKIIRFLDKKTVIQNGGRKTEHDELAKLVLKDLREIISETFSISENDIDMHDSMEQYGLDLVSSSEIVRKINEKYGTELISTNLIDFTSFHNLCEHIVKEYKNILTEYYQADPQQSEEGEREIDVDIAAMAFTLQTGREAMEERLAVIASDPEELREKLVRYCEGKEHVDEIYTGNTKNDKTKVDFLFETAGEQFIRTIIKDRQLDKIAKLWTSGLEIDWRLLYEGQTPARIMLPGYPFAKESYWLTVCKGRSFEQVASSIEEQKCQERTYCILEKDWIEEKKDLPDDYELKGTLIVAVNDETKTLANHLFKNRHDVHVITIQNSSSYSVNGNEYSLDFAKEEHGIQAAKGIFNNGKAIVGFIDLSDLNEKPIERCKSNISKVIILQNLIKKINQEKLYILHLTKGLQTYKTEQTTLAGADFAGFVKMLSAEYRKVQSKTVDIDDMEHLSDIILREITVQDNISEVCYRDGKRHIPNIKEVHSGEVGSSVSNSQHVSVGTDKVIVVSGGMRGIGAEVAKYLANIGVRKLVLMGIQEMPPREQWQSLLGGSTGEKHIIKKIKMIIDLEQKGVTVKTFSGPLTEKNKLEEFFNVIRREMGEIGGVIHCAGLAALDNPAFINKSSRDILKVFEPKVEGLQVMHEVFKSDRLDFFILFSSVSALCPVLASGMSDYAAANSFMDFFAAYQYSMGNTYYRSINWPSWKETGMGEIHSPIYRSLGFEALLTVDGILMLDDIIKVKRGSCLAPCIIKPHKFSPDALLAVRHGGEMVSNMKSSSNVYGQGDKAHIDMKSWLKGLFSKELKITEEKLDDDKSFGEFGVDSILLAELVKRVEEKVNAKLDPSIFMEYPTLEQLSSYLDRNFPAAFNPHETSDAYVYDVEEEPEIVIQNKMLALNTDRENSYNCCGYPDGQSHSKIAVIGMACHFPGAKNKEAFWENLKEGKSSITEVPKSRWEVERYYSPEYQMGKSISKWGGFIEDIEYFDPEYFNIKEEEAPHIDPLIRKFLEVSAETLRDAGYVSHELWSRKVGVFVGSRVANYSERILQPLKTSIIGIGQNFIAAHISHLFNFKGPSIVVDTACSSSLVSIHLACQSLISGESDIALAGGVDILLDEKVYLILSEGRALSPDGKCHTFDEKANGFVPGEGCGAVLLKPLDRAIADGDKIYAVIEASAVNNDGHTMGITTPNPEAQSDVIREALKRGSINPENITYIEAHGTGTMIGDPIELKALTKVFRESTDERQFCAVGSVKTNIGHLLSAAGIAGFIKVALSIWNRQIPPTLNCEKPNARFEFESSPFYPNVSLKDWDVKGDIRRAGISSFGFGGTNAHIIISECESQLLDNYKRVKETLPYINFKHKKYWLDKCGIESEISPNKYQTVELLSLTKEDEELIEKIKNGDIPSLLELVDESTTKGDKSE